MAILESDGLALEIKFKPPTYNTVEYTIKFLWQGQPIIRDEILKRHSDYWTARESHSFIAGDYDRDFVFDSIRKSLDNDTSVEYETLDPDFCVAIRPVPCVKLFDEVKDDTERKAEAEKKPEDCFEVFFKLDAYNFDNSDAYAGHGVALYFTLYRKELEQFYSNLYEEYQAYRAQYADILRDNFIAHPPE